MAVSRNNGRGQKGKRVPRGRQFPKRQPTNMANGLRLGFRSGLEALNAEVLINAGVSPDLFESLKIPYTVPQSEHTYTPDFPLPNGVIVETKGKLELSDRKKHLLVKKQYPDLDIRFVFQRPHDPIRKGSPTTYAKWCDKNGFKWATRTIPSQWILEEGPKRKPEEVLSDA